MKNNLKSLQINNENNITYNYIDVSSMHKQIIIEKSSCYFFDNFDDENDVDIIVESNVSSRLSFLIDKKTPLHNNINIQIKKYSEIECYFADLSGNSIDVKVNIKLDGENSSIRWKTASLNTKSNNKKIDISLYHNFPFTNGIIENFGICKDESILTFTGISKICKDSIKSISRQDAKILIFDEKCVGCAKPILKIDENDVLASHGAVVGKINEDHMFYLQSRGLSENDAKKLIVLGYLKPILNGFEDSSIKDRIEKIINREI